jgi:hypothetical protein
VDKMLITLTHIIGVFLVKKGIIKGNVDNNKMLKVADMGKFIHKFYFMSFDHLPP